jgi:hypothetical protein
MSDTVIKTSGQPVVIDPSTGGAGTWAASLVAGTPTGPRSPALSAGQAFVDELPSGGWRCTTQAGAAGVAGPLTFFACGSGAVGQFGGTFGVQSGASTGGGAAGTMLLGSASPTSGSTFSVNAGSGGGNAGVASGNIRFGTQAPGPGGNQGDWAVTGPGAMLGVQARATMPNNVNATQGGYWGLISGPSSVPMYRDNVGADRQIQLLTEQAFQAVATATAVVATNADNNFHAVPGAAFAESAAAPLAFTLGAADCIATYGGNDTKRFLVRVIVATHAIVGAGFANWTGCVAVNGDVLATAGGTQRLNGEVNINDTGTALDDSEQRGVFERVVTLSTGNTVQPAIARFAGTAAVDLDATWLTMTITEVN